MGAFEQLYEGGASAEVALRAAVRNVEELARYDGRFVEAAQQLESARATLGDVSASLRDYAEGINASPSAWPRLKTGWPRSIVSNANTARPWPRSSRLAKKWPASWPKWKIATRF
jgi:hypothetical protein